ARKAARWGVILGMVLLVSAGALDPIGTPFALLFSLLPPTGLGRAGRAAQGHSPTGLSACQTGLPPKWEQGSWRWGSTPAFDTLAALGYEEPTPIQRDCLRG